MTVRVDVHLGSGDLADSLRNEAREGLTATPKALSSKWFYDDRGSALFEEITRLPEYYPFRCERAILGLEAPAIARRCSADTLVELGSGTSEKTHLLLEALREAGTLRRFIPFDVSEATLREAAVAIAERFEVDVHGVVGDFEQHLDRIPGGGNRLVAFLGGTIGNLDPAARKSFLATVADGLSPGDHLLLGTDLVKGRDRLVAAYDDESGITAAFNRNLLHVLNRELDAGFDPDAFDHVALWDADQEWIEMRLRASRAMDVPVASLDLDVHFHEDEEMRTEISAKFRREGIETELAGAGLELAEWWTDPAGDYALSLSRPC